VLPVAVVKITMKIRVIQEVGIFRKPGRILNFPRRLCSMKPLKRVFNKYCPKYYTGLMRQLILFQCSFTVSKKLKQLMYVELEMNVTISCRNNNLSLMKDTTLLSKSQNP
jgi:hypothetical protein